MTDSDQTVPVPVKLLKEIERNGTYEYDYLTGAEAHLSGAGASALKDLVALIPSPPKVGDVLTADQIKDLPDAAVMRDRDGDVLVKARDMVRRATMDLWSVDESDWSVDDIQSLVETYSPITLVSLLDPRD